MVHEIAVALLVRAVQPHVFVKVEGGAVRKGELPLRAELHQVGVEAERRGAGGQAEDGVGLGVEQVYITLRCLGAGFLLGADDKFHI